MKPTIVFLTVFMVAGWGLAFYHATVKRSCPVGICDDPRACRIEWDDGSVQYKSRVIELGTLLPGESVIVNLFDPNDILSVTVTQDNQTWMPVGLISHKIPTGEVVFSLTYPDVNVPLIEGEMIWDDRLDKKAMIPE